MTLVPVDAADVRLDRLLQLYVFEWSALVPAPIGPDARYTYPGLDEYDDRARHAAYLFVDDDLPVGFALVSADDAGTWHVKEFFTILGVRRRGLGLAAARQLLATQARWTWTVRPENAAALAFWRRVASDAVITAEPGADGIVRTRFRT